MATIIAFPKAAPAEPARTAAATSPEVIVFPRTNIRVLQEHDPEKHVLDPDRGWAPVFGKDHAPQIT